MAQLLGRILMRVKYFGTLCVKYYSQISFEINCNEKDRKKALCQMKQLENIVITRISM